MQKGFVPILVLVGILVIIVVAGGGIYWVQKINKEPSTDRAVLHLKQLSDTDKIIDPKSSTDQNQDETANPDQIGANWKTWKNTNLKYEFQYPVDWEIGDSEQGSNSSVIQNIQKKYYLVINFISKNQLNLMGITYCGAYPEDKIRCEVAKVNGSANTIIDWGFGDKNETKAIVSIPHPEGLITFELTPINLETKEILYKLLSTFKFN